MRVEHVETEWAFATSDDQAAVRRRTEAKLEPVVRKPGYNVAGLCLNVLAE